MVGAWPEECLSARTAGAGHGLQVQVTDCRCRLWGGFAMWWGKRKRRGTQLSRLLALGKLQDAMARAEEQQLGSSDPVPHPAAGRPADSPEQDAMLAADGPARRRGDPQ